MLSEWIKAIRFYFRRIEMFVQHQHCITTFQLRRIMFKNKNFLLSFRSFGAKCAKCCRNIAPTDWVRRAKDQVFHLACFSCDQCGRQLSTGEQFAMIDEQVLCKSHYYEMDGSTTSSDGKCFAFLWSFDKIILNHFTQTATTATASIKTNRSASERHSRRSSCKCCKQTSP